MSLKRAHGCRVQFWTADDGHRYAILENATIRISILITQGADIVEMRFKPKDLDVLWHSPQGVQPVGTFIPTVRQESGDLLDYAHGGWFESLPNGFFPGLYYGAQLGKHGEVALLPWQIQVIEDGVDIVALRCSARCRRTPFLLERTMSIAGDEPVVRMDERLLNEGEEPLSFMWGHHPSFGPPFLAEGCLLELPPCTAHTIKDLAQPYARYRLGQERQWPFLATVAGDNVRADVVLAKSERTSDSFYLSGLSEGHAAVLNPTLRLRVWLRWDHAVFPYLWCWQAYGGQWGYPYYGRTFNVALEPFTSPMMSFADCEQLGLAPKLGPGESLTTYLTAGFSEVN